MSFLEIVLVFISGGLLSVAAQLLIDLTRLTPARILVLYVSMGIVLFSIGIYEPMKEIFGSGVGIPLLGFGANIAKGTREAVDKDGLFGILTGGLSSSAAGICAALFSGLIFSMICRSKPKRM